MRALPGWPICSGVRTALAILALLAIGAAGCQPGLLATSGRPDPAGQVGPETLLLPSNVPFDARIEGSARGPAGLVADNSIGLVADNSIGLAGDRGSRFRIASTYPEEVVPKALVFLGNPDGKFFVGPDGRTLAEMTDEKGQFSFPAAPSGTSLIVNVMLGQERRLVGFLVARPGGNRVTVSMGSSLVTEYLRDQARRRRKTPADFDLSRLDELLALTQRMLDGGGMGTVDPAHNVPDLRISAVPALVNAYAGAVARDPALAVAWEGVLGYRPLAVEMPLGPANVGMALQGIAASPDGSRVALAFSGSRPQVWLMSRAELADVLGGPEGTYTADELPGTRIFEGVTSWLESRFGGSHRLNTEIFLQYPEPFLYDPGVLAWAPDGRLILADRMQAVGSKDTTWLYRIDPSAPFRGNYDRLILAEPLAAVEGMAFDAMGNLYLSDGPRHVIRRIGAAEAAAESLPLEATASWPCAVAGCEIEVDADRVATASDPVVAGMLGLPGFVGPAGETLLSSPRGLAWDGGGVLVADTGNRAIRLLAIDAAGRPGALQLVAGGGRVAMPGGPFGLASDDAATYRGLGFKYPFRLASDARGRTAVLDSDRIVLLQDGKGQTIVGSYWAAFADGGDSRRADLPDIQSIGWFGASLLIGTFNAPVLSRVIVGTGETP